MASKGSSQGNGLTTNQIRALTPNQLDEHNLTFSQKLKWLQISKSDLSRSLGMAKNTISRWGDNPAQYVEVYVDELIYVKRLEAWNKYLQDQLAFE